MSIQFCARLLRSFNFAKSQFPEKLLHLGLLFPGPNQVNGVMASRHIARPILCICCACIRSSVCVCVSNWAVPRVWRALESMLVGHRATKPPSQRAATLVGRAPATLPPSQLAQLPTTATSPPCPTLSRLECATTQRGAQRCVPNHQQGVPLRCPGQEDMPS